MEMLRLYFLRYIKPIETLEIIDTHSVGIKNVEQQHELVTLCLNLPNANDIDYHAFYHLKNVFCYGDKRMILYFLVIV